MLGRTVFAATLLALAEFAVATPPACLLGAASQFSSPVDMKSVCQSKDLKSEVAKICGNDADAAMAALADICNAQSVQICVPSATAPLSTGSSPKSTGAGASHVTPMYPTGTGSGSSSHSGNSTVPAATGTPKPPVSSSPAATSTRAPNNSGAGKLEFGLAAVVAGIMAAAFFNNGIIFKIPRDWGTEADSGKKDKTVAALIDSNASIAIFTNNQFIFTCAIALLAARFLVSTIVLVLVLVLVIRFRFRALSFIVTKTAPEPLVACRKLEELPTKDYRRAHSTIV
ncbi:uncharacterized protein yc1106_04046 [Curvularia clavata]|uniref:Uncharacterized protein n=1 Tax=Curvularia clavata TaxID=95742 RepID=A0A9Q8Z6Y1_CURCL|nr:uncharacterized protein yc1106_04046 [Curvularia clavata]